MYLDIDSAVFFSRLNIEKKKNHCSFCSRSAVKRDHMQLSLFYLSFRDIMVCPVVEQKGLRLRTGF